MNNMPGKVCRAIMTSKNAIGLLVLFTLPLFILGVFDHPLWTNDEGHVAEIGREMFESGDVIVPRLAGEPFVEKPPLYFMAMCASYRLFGVTPGAARLPSAIFGFLTVLFTYCIAARLGNHRQGLIAGVVLASASMIFRFSHWCVVDAAVCCFSTLAFYLFIAGYTGESHKKTWYLGLHVAIALAFMTKGLIAPVMIGIAVVSLLIWNRDLRELRRMRLLPGLLIVSAFAAPWLYLLWNIGGWDLLKNFLIDNNIGRFCSKVSNQYQEHVQGPFYYFIDFLGNFLPWTPVFIPAIVLTFRNTDNPETSRRTFNRFLFSGFVANIIISSFSATKRGVYLLPLYPLAALMIGGWLDNLLNGRAPARWERTCIWFQAIFIAVAPVALIGIGIYTKAFPLTLSITLASAFFVLASIGITNLTRSNLGATAASLGVQAVLIYLAITTLIFPVISPYKHYTPFFETLRAITRPGDIVAIYGNVGESNLGQGCISMQRVLPVIRNPEHAIVLLHSSGNRFLLVIEDGQGFDELIKLLGSQPKIAYSLTQVNPLPPNRKRTIYCLTNN